MRSPKELENERNEQVRMQCIDYATRIVGRATYITDGVGEIKKFQDDVIEVAKQIHKFVTG